MAVRVTLERVSVHYGQRAGLRDLTLDVPPGEFLGVVGPSGSGKSTTLRVIAGLTRITSGRVLFDGREVQDDRPASRNVGMVFQQFGLYPRTTVKENILLPLRARGVDISTARKQVASLAERIGIETLLSRSVEEISGGEQQRVALARALIRKPPLLLLDEPLASLDVSLRSSLRNLFSELHQEQGMTVLYVTHDPLEVALLAQRVAVLEAGQLVQLGRFSELERQPATFFIAQHSAALPLNVGEGILNQELPGCWYLQVDQERLTLKGIPEGVSSTCAVSWTLNAHAVGASPGGTATTERIVSMLGIRLARIHGERSWWAVAHDGLTESSNAEISIDPGAVKLFRKDGTAIRILDQPNAKSR